MLPTIDASSEDPVMQLNVPSGTAIQLKQTSLVPTNLSLAECMTDAERIQGDTGCTSSLNPVVADKRKRELLSSLANDAGLSKHTLNFLNLLLDQDRLVATQEIFNQFEIQYCKLTDTQVGFCSTRDTRVAGLLSIHMKGLFTLLCGCNVFVGKDTNNTLRVESLNGYCAALELNLHLTALNLPPFCKLRAGGSSKHAGFNNCWSVVIRTRYYLQRKMDNLPSHCSVCRQLQASIGPEILSAKPSVMLSHSHPCACRWQHCGRQCAWSRSSSS